MDNFELVYNQLFQSPQVLSEGFEEDDTQRAQEQRSAFLENLLLWVRTNYQRETANIEPFPSLASMYYSTTISYLATLAHDTVLGSPSVVDFTLTDAANYTGTANEPMELECEETLEELEEMSQEMIQHFDLSIFEEVEEYCKQYNLLYGNCNDPSNAHASFVISVEQLAGSPHYNLNKIVVLNTHNMQTLANLIDRLLILERDPTFLLPEGPEVEAHLERMLKSTPMPRNHPSRKKKFKQALITVPRYFPKSQDPNILRSIFKDLFESSKKSCHTEDAVYFSYVNGCFEMHENGDPHLHIAMTVHSKGSFYTRSQLLKFFADYEILPPNRIEANPYNILNITLSTKHDKPDGPHPYVAKSYRQQLASKTTPVFTFADEEYLGYVGAKTTSRCKEAFLPFLCDTILLTADAKQDQFYAEKAQEQKRQFKYYTQKFKSLKEPFEADVRKLSSALNQAKSEEAIIKLNEALWVTNARLLDMLPEKSSQITQQYGTSFALDNHDLYTVFDFAYSRGYTLDYISWLNADECFPALLKAYTNYPSNRKRLTNQYVRKQFLSIKDMDFGESKKYCQEKNINFTQYHDSIIQKMLSFTVDCIKKQKRANILWIHGPPLRGKTKYVNWLRQYCSCVAGPLAPGQFILSSDSSSPDVFVYDDDVKPQDFGKMVEMWNSLSTSSDLVLSVKYDVVKTFRPSILICTNHKMESVFQKQDLGQNLEALKKRVSYIDLSAHDLILPPEFTGFSYAQILEMTDSIEHKDSHWIAWYTILRNQNKYPFFENTLDLEDTENHEEALEKINKWTLGLPEKIQQFPKYFMPFIAYKLQNSGVPKNLHSMMFKAIDCGLDKCSKEDLVAKLGSLNREEFEVYTPEKYREALLQLEDDYEKEDCLVMTNGQVQAEIVKHSKSGCDIRINGVVYPQATVVGDNVQKCINMLRELGFEFPKPVNDDFAPFKRPGSPLSEDEEPCKQPKPLE